MKRLNPRWLLPLALLALLMTSITSADSTATALAAGETISVHNESSSSLSVQFAPSEGATAFSANLVVYGADGTASNLRILEEQTAPVSISLPAEAELVLSAETDLTLTAPDGGLTVQSIDQSALEVIPLSQGSSLEVSRPSDDAVSHAVWLRSAENLLYHRLTYNTADCSDVSILLQRSSGTISLSAGSTLHIDPQEDLEVLIPSRYLDNGLTTQTADCAAITAVSLPAGHTLKASLPAEAALSFSAVVDTPDGAYSEVTYQTDTKGSVQYRPSHKGAPYSMQAGFTQELTALDAACTVYFPAFAAEQFGLTTQLYEGSPLTYATIPKGQTLRASMAAGETDLAFQFWGRESGHGANVIHNYITYHTASYSDMDYRAYASGRQQTLKSGYTLEITALDEDLSYCYPAFLPESATFLSSLLTEDPMVHVDIEVGKTLRTQLSANAREGVTLRMRSLGNTMDYGHYSLVRYQTSDYTDVSFSAASSSNHYGIGVGYTTLFTAQSKPIEFFYPKYLASYYGFTTAVEEEDPLHYFTVEPGSYLTIQLPANAVASARVQSRNAQTKNDWVDHQWVNYRTADYTNVIFSPLESSDHSIDPGRTLLIAPTQDTMEFYYPKFLLSQYGMTCTTATGSIMTARSVSNNTSLSILLPASAPDQVNLKPRSTAARSYDQVRYNTSSYTNVYYDVSTSNSDLYLNANETLLFASHCEGMAIHYPTLFETVYGLTLQPFTGDVLCSFSAVSNQTLTVSLPSGAPADVTITQRSGTNPYPASDYVTYNTDTRAVSSFEAGRAVPNRGVARGFTLELSPVSADIEFSYPAIYRDVYGLTASLSEGEPLVITPVETGFTIRAVLNSGPSAGVPLGFVGQQSTYVWHDVLTYVYSDCSDVEYASGKSSPSYTLTPGYCIELAPVGQNANFIYPSFYDALYGLSVEQPYPGNPITVETLEPGTILKASLPENKLGNIYLSLRWDASYYAPTVSHVQYDSQTYSSITYEYKKPLSRYDLKQGYTCLLCAEDHPLEFYFPTFYLHRYGLSFNTEEKGHPLVVGTLNAGYTLQASLREDASPLTFQLTNGTNYNSVMDRVTYQTADCSGIQFTVATGLSYQTLSPGKTAELSPLETTTTYYYPKLFESHGGLSVETPYPGSPITRGSVEKGHTVRFALPADATITANIQLAQASEGNPTLERLRYVTADASGLTFSPEESAGESTCMPGYTLELAPTRERLDFFYATVYARVFGLTQSTYQGSPMTRKTVSDSEGLRLALPADAAVSLPLNLSYGTGSASPSSYFYLEYDSENPADFQMQCDARDAKKTLSPGRTAEFGGVFLPLTITYPTFLEERLGFTPAVMEHSPVVCDVVEPNNILTISLPAQVEEKLSLSLSGETYDFVVFQTENKGVHDFTPKYSGKDVFLSGGQTQQFAPLGETLRLWYPWYLKQSLGFQSACAEGSLIKEHIVSGSQLLKASSAPGATAAATLKLASVSNGALSYSFARYTADSDAQDQLAKPSSSPYQILHPGDIAELSAANAVYVRYPLMYEEPPFLLSCEAGENDGNVEFTADVGQTLAFSLDQSYPDSVAIHVQAETGAPRYHTMSYSSADFSSLSIVPNRVRTVTFVSRGTTLEISPVSGKLTFRFPESLVGALTVSEVQDYCVLDSTPVSPEETLRVVLPQNAPSDLSLMADTAQSSTVKFSKISYETTDYSNLDTIFGQSNQLKVLKGQSCEVTPEQDAAFYYPKYTQPCSPAASALGLTCEILERPSFIFQPVEVGNVLSLSLAGSSSNSSITVHPTGEDAVFGYYWMAYDTTTKNNCVYGQTSGECSVSAGRTLFIEPKERAITICYPAVLDGTLSSTLLPYQSLFYELPMSQGDTFRFTPLDSPYQSLFSFENLAGNRLSFAVYNNKDGACVQMSHSTADAIRITKQQSVDITCESDSGKLLIPKYWEDGLLLKPEISSVPALVATQIPEGHEAVFDLTGSAEFSYTQAYLHYIPWNAGDISCTQTITDSLAGTQSTHKLSPNTTFQMTKNPEYRIYMSDTSATLYVPGRHASQHRILMNNLPLFVKETCTEITPGAPGTKQGEDEVSIRVLTWIPDHGFLAVSGAEVTLGGTTAKTDFTGHATFPFTGTKAEVRVTAVGYRNFEAVRTFDSTNRTAGVTLTQGSSSSTPYIMSASATYRTQYYDLLHNTLLVYKRTSAEQGIPEDSVSLDVRVEWGGETGRVGLYRFDSSSCTYKLLEESTSGYFDLESIAAKYENVNRFYLGLISQDGKQLGSYQPILLSTKTIKENVKWDLGLLDLALDFKLLPNFNFKTSDKDAIINDKAIASLMESLPSFKYEAEDGVTRIGIGIERGDSTEETSPTPTPSPSPSPSPSQPPTSSPSYSLADMAADIKSLYSQAKNLSTADAEAAKTGKSAYQSAIRSIMDKAGGKSSELVTSGFGDVDINKSPNVSADFSLCGYMVLQNMGNGRGVTDFMVVGGAAVDIEELVDFTHQYVVAYIPVYVSVGLSPSMGAEVSLTFGDGVINTAGAATSSFALDASAGIGIHKVAGAGVDGKASLDALYEFKYPIKLDSKDFSNLASKIQLVLNGSLAVSASLFDQTVASLEFFSREHTLFSYPEKGSAYASFLTLDETGSPQLYNLGEVDLSAPLGEEDLHHRDYDSVWVGSEPRITPFSREPQPEEEQLILSNLPDTSKPILAQMGEDRVLVWLADHDERSVRDRTMLVWSVWDADLGVWSEPLPVWDTGTADLLPSVQGEWLVWQKLDQQMDADEVSILDMAAASEIAVARWNGETFESPVFLTNDSSLDCQPVVASDGDHTAVVWTRNSKDNPIGTEGVNSVMARILEADGSWSTPILLANNRSAITDLAAAYDGDVLRVVLNEDADNSLLTIDDWALNLLTVDQNRTVSETVLTQNGLDPQFIRLGEELALFFNQGSTVRYLTDLSGSGTPLDVLSGQSITTNSYVTTNAAGEAALIWTGAYNDGTEIYTSLYDGQSWTPAIPVTDGDGQIISPTGIRNEDGSVDLAFVRKYEIYNTQDDGSYAFSNLSDLRTFRLIPGYDLSAGQFFYSDRDVIPGAQLDLKVDVSNLGERTVDAVQVRISSEDGQIDQTVVANNSALAIRETKTLSIPVTIPATLPRQELSLEITPVVGDAPVADRNTENNGVSTHIGGCDLVLGEGTLFVSRDPGSTEEFYSFMTTVSSVGLDTSSDITVALRKNTSYGPALAVQTLEGMEPGTSRMVSFDMSVSRGAEVSPHEFYYITVSTQDETYMGNNSSEFQLIRPEYEQHSRILSVTPDAEDPTQVTVDGLLINETSASYNGTAYCAIYDPNGRMTGIALADLSVDSYVETPFSIPVELDCAWSEGCTAKLIFTEADSKSPVFTILSQS